MIEKDTGKRMINVLGGQLRIEQNNNRLLVSKDLIDVLLLGQEDDGDIVIKLAKDGFDVKAATSDQLIMSSEFNLPKIVVDDVITLTPPAIPTPGLTTTFYTHNLGYVPTFIAFWEFDGTTYFPVPKYWFTNTGTLAMSLEAYSTATDFNIDFTYVAASPSGYPGPINIRFYLLRETAS